VAAWALSQGASAHMLVRLGSPTWGDAGPSQITNTPVYNIYDPAESVAYHGGGVAMSRLQHGTGNLPQGTNNWHNVRVNAPYDPRARHGGPAAIGVSKHTAGMRSVKVLRQAWNGIMNLMGGHWK